MDLYICTQIKPYLFGMQSNIILLWHFAGMYASAIYNQKKKKCKMNKNKCTNEGGAIGEPSLAEKQQQA